MKGRAYRLKLVLVKLLLLRVAIYIIILYIASTLLTRVKS